MIVYRIAPGWQADLVQVEEALAKAPFMECGATQEKSLGWVPPRGEQHGALAGSYLTLRRIARPPPQAQAWPWHRKQPRQPRQGHSHTA